MMGERTFDSAEDREPRRPAVQALPSVIITPHHLLPWLRKLSNP